MDKDKERLRSVKVQDLKPYKGLIYLAGAVNVASKEEGIGTAFMSIKKQIVTIRIRFGYKVTNMKGSVRPRAGIRLALLLRKR
jgi:hypothetical protein